MDGQDYFALVLYLVILWCLQCKLRVELKMYNLLLGMNMTKNFSFTQFSTLINLTACCRNSYQLMQISKSFLKQLLCRFQSRHKLFFILWPQVSFTGIKKYLDIPTGQVSAGRVWFIIHLPLIRCQGSFLRIPISLHWSILHHSFGINELPQERKNVRWFGSKFDTVPTGYIWIVSLKDRFALAWTGKKT